MEITRTIKYLPLLPTKFISVLLAFRENFHILCYLAMRYIIVTFLKNTSAYFGKYRWPMTARIDTSARALFNGYFQRNKF